MEKNKIKKKIIINIQIHTNTQIIVILVLKVLTKCKAHFNALYCPKYLINSV